MCRALKIVKLLFMQTDIVSLLLEVRVFAPT